MQRRESQYRMMAVAESDRKLQLVATLALTGPVSVGGTTADASVAHENKQASGSDRYVGRGRAAELNRTRILYTQE